MEDFQRGPTELQSGTAAANRTADFWTLDSVARPRQISGLRVSGFPISWLHDGKRRTPRIV